MEGAVTGGLDLLLLHVRVHSVLVVYQDYTLAETVGIAINPTQHLLLKGFVWLQLL